MSDWLNRESEEPEKTPQMAQITQMRIFTKRTHRLRRRPTLRLQGSKLRNEPMRSAPAPGFEFKVQSFRNYQTKPLDVR